MMQGLTEKEQLRTTTHTDVWDQLDHMLPEIKCSEARHIAYLQTTFIEASVRVVTSQVAEARQTVPHAALSGVRSMHVSCCGQE